MRLITVPPELLYVHDRLENWGRWARSGGRGGSVLGSAEGRYRPERLGIEAELQRRKPTLEIDIADASAVDRALSPATGYPKHWSRMLKAAYVWNELAAVVCRQGSINKRDLDIELRRALQAADNRLSQRGESPGLSPRVQRKRLRVD